MGVYDARHHLTSIEYDSNTCVLSLEMKDFNVEHSTSAAQ